MLVLADATGGFIAVHLRHHHVHQYDVDLGIVVQHPQRVVAVLGVLHVHLVTLEDAGQGNDVADVVVDDQRLLAFERRVAAVQLIEQPLLLWRQRAFHAMQEQRGLVEQPLRRLDVLDDDGLRQRSQLALFLARQLLAGIDDYRHLRHRAVGAHLLEELEPIHVVEAEVEDDAVVVAARELIQGFGAGSDRGDLDVAIADQLDQRVALRLVVFDDQQRAHLAIVERLDRVEGVIQVLPLAGLGDEGLGAQAHAAMRIVGHRDHVYGDVTRGGIVLEAIEHVPAVETRQIEVERDGVGTMLPGHLQADVAANGRQYAELVFAAEIHQDARKRLIVFDDQQYAVSRLDALPVVEHRIVVDRRFLGFHRAIDRNARLHRRFGALGGGERRDIYRWQVERERAAVPD